MKISATHPAYLGVFTCPNCFVYCDKTKEKNGDYLELARIYFRPLELKIYRNKPEYKAAIDIATAEYENIKTNIDTPIVVSGTGQTITAII